MPLLIWLAIPFALVVFLAIRRSLQCISVNNLQAKSVLITGCDSGFGFDLALRCLSEGLCVFAACLSEEGRNKIEKNASSSTTKGTLHAFRMDVSSAESVARGREFVESKLSPLGRGLHAIVNNAGIVGNTAWDDWLLPEDYEQTLSVNTLGSIRVTQTFKRLVKMERGSRIVFMASTCGRVALPALGPYNVSKFAIEAYGDTLRSELLLFGVKVCILEPGFFRTPLTSVEKNVAMLERIWKRAPNTVKEDYGQEMFDFSRERLLNLIDPKKLSFRTDLVVDAYWHAISAEWPKRRYQIGRDIKLFFLPFSFLPAEVQDLFYTILTIFERTPKPKMLLTTT